MTARVLRPTLTTVLAVLAAALAVYALSTSGGARADSVYNPTTAVWMCNKLPASFAATDGDLDGDATCGEGGPAENLAAGAAADFTTILNMPSGGLNFSNVVTLSPNAPTVVGAGAKVGGLRSLTNLGLANNQCNTALTVDFVFYNVALPNAATRAGMTNVGWMKGFGVTDRFEHWKVGDGVHTSNPPVTADADWATTSDTAVTSGNGFNADGTNIGFANYPIHLLDIFDPDFVPGVGDGATEPLIPTAVYGGMTLVAGDWIPLYFAIFPAGGLATLPPPLGLITSAMGVPSVSILTDPSAVQPSPSTISDFCTSLNVTTMLLGTVRTNPAAGTNFYLQYNASLRDTDQDGYENSIDTCPLTTPSAAGGENPRVTPGAGDDDADDDGIKDSCDLNLPTPTPPAVSGIADRDGDLYQNRQDNCPQIANSNSEAELGVVAGDRGPRTDGMGDTCDTGSITVIQNNRPVIVSGGCGAGPPIGCGNTAGSLSTTVGNGRYLVRANLVPKCFSGTDLDKDGYCVGSAIAPDTAATDSGTCATTVPNSCFFRHGSFIIGACTSAPSYAGACAMDSDGDTVTPTSGALSNWSDVIETYLGTDATKPCSQDNGADNEAPLDNLPLDVTDNRGVAGNDWLRAAAAINATGGSGRAVNMGGNGDGTATTVATVTVPIMGVQPQNRFDLNWDGNLILGSDLGKYNAYMNKSCGGAGMPPTTANGTGLFQQ